MSTTTNRPLGGEVTAQDAAVVELLTRACWMEIETVINYLAASTNLDGIRAREVARALDEDVAEEFGHARRIAARLKELDAIVPGSLDFAGDQDALQPADDQADVVHVIEAVLEAEEAAIEQYRRLIETTDRADWVTQDLAIRLLGDEEAYRRLFQGFLREYE